MAVETTYLEVLAAMNIKEAWEGKKGGSRGMKETRSIRRNSWRRTTSFPSCKTLSSSWEKILRTTKACLSQKLTPGPNKVISWRIWRATPVATLVILWATRMIKAWSWKIWNLLWKSRVWIKKKSKKYFWRMKSWERRMRCWRESWLLSRWILMRSRTNWWNCTSWMRATTPRWGKWRRTSTSR